MRCFYLNRRSTKLAFQPRVANSFFYKNRSAQKDSADVAEILKIEKELARVQTELDSLETRLRQMNNQVQLASIALQLEQARFTTAKR
ncbi:MAG: seryl-tRNA synthetase [Verrucomicrobiales bacterium]